MKLSSPEIKELRKALIDAFPSKAKLKRLIRESDLNITLDEIIIGEDLNDIVSEIIDWVESRDKLDILVKAAYEDNPGNQKLEVFVIKKYPSIFILIKYWKEIKSILQDIKNEENIDLGSACRLTLRNITRYKNNVESQFPESINPDIDNLQQIFLQKCLYNDQQKPTIIEFAERLAKEVKQSYNQRLNQWVRDVANKLNIKLPTYSSMKSSLISQSKLTSYLLIVVEAKGGNKVSLQAELITNYQSEQNLGQLLPINLETDKPVIDCLFTEISDNIYSLIKESREQLYSYSNSFDLIIEVFLPFQYLYENIEFQELNIQNESRVICHDNRFVARSFERFYLKNEEYLNKLTQRWQTLRIFLNNSQLTDTKVIEQFESINTVENCNFDNLYLTWEDDKILGLKFTCCLPQLENDKINLFKNVLNAGIPICLWTRHNQLNNIDINTEFDKLLNITALNNYLVDSVHQLRREACKMDDKENHLGYHVGFLCDNPNRIPSRFTRTLNN